MNFMGNDQLEGDSSFKIDKKEQTPSFSIDSNENPVPVLQQIENSKSIEGLVQKTLSVAGKEKTERDISVISPGMKAPQTCGSSGEELEKEWNQAGCTCIVQCLTRNQLFMTYMSLMIKLYMERRMVEKKADH
ncbi:hypothetical protein GH714_025933 [Hevea brasiliensis]|uniref:Uncharacterized protein n=1 Tax=Hevea brasiliensis TaxID=3981 RepID=A0A6A6K6S5_HEVBR|nr:hypothetical protein GH714_025933 [Hevea brasiliensis]